MLKTFFLLQHVEAELWDFKDISVHPRKPYFSLKNEPFDLFFYIFLQNKLFSGKINLYSGSESYHFRFSFFDPETLI